jgi:hypothetical protein
LFNDYATPFSNVLPATTTAQLTPVTTLATSTADLVMPGNAQLQYVGATTKHAWVTCNIVAFQPAAITNCFIQIYKNGVLMPNAEFRQGINVQATIAFSFITTLDPNDILTIYRVNAAGATTTVNFQVLNLTVALA